MLENVPYLIDIIYIEEQSQKIIIVILTSVGYPLYSQPLVPLVAMWCRYSHIFCYVFVSTL